MDPKDKVLAAYQATSDSVAKKLEALYNSLDPNEKRVFESVLGEGTSSGATATPTMAINTSVSLHTSKAVKLMSKVACW